MRTCTHCGHQWTACRHMCPSCGQLPEGYYGEHLPSPEDIQRLTAEIRSSWSPTERRSRARWAFSDPNDSLIHVFSPGRSRVNRKDANAFE